MGEVIELGWVPATDIVGQLRQMADDIESGRYQFSSSYFIAVEGQNYKPLIFGWGNIPSVAETLGVLALVQATIVNGASR